MVCSNVKKLLEIRRKGLVSRKEGLPDPEAKIILHNITLMTYLEGYEKLLPSLKSSKHRRKNESPNRTEKPIPNFDMVLSKLDSLKLKGFEDFLLLASQTCLTYKRRVWMRPIRSSGESLKNEDVELLLLLPEARVRKEDYLESDPFKIRLTHWIKCSFFQGFLTAAKSLAKD